jgi:diguanylate cyclase (GGDEF)-like protein
LQFYIMDAFTAGIALVIVQLCAALFMTGAFYTTPKEACTRYWARSGFLFGLGVLIVVINNGAPNYLFLVLGNNCLFAGIIFQWWGLQAFYGKQPSRQGWILLIAFFLLYASFLFNKAAQVDRAALVSIAVACGFGLNLSELRWQRANRLSFATLLAFGSVVLLIAAMATRALACLLRHSAFALLTQSTVGVVIVYLMPLIGTLLFSVALLMLYFERLVEIKHHLATHDELTHLLNRRAIIAGGEREIEMAVRSQQPLTIAYIDVDFFKRINDELGHANGDTVLSELADILRGTCRTTDLIGRYGGEEFCVVLPGIGYDGAAAFGDRLLQAVRQRLFCNKQPVTISIGFAVLRITGQRRTWTSLMLEADAALYQAKEGGRDQFVIAGQDATHMNPKLA